MNEVRLIDANALRDHAFEVCQGNGVERETLMVVPLAEINNAPTVGYTFEEAFQKTVCEQKLYCPNRPQGEWIKDGHHIRCNKCNEYICDTDREGNKIPDNFCPNCGADMRGDNNGKSSN